MENETSNNFRDISELESYTIKCLLTNQVLLSRFISEIKQAYFRASVNLTIFKIIKNYYDDFQTKIPKDEIPLRLESILPRSNAEDKYKELRALCLNTIDEMFNSSEINVESASKNVASFIVQRLSEFSLNKLIETMTDTSVNDFESKSFYAMQECAKEISNSASLTFSFREPFNLADLKRIKEIREDALGTDENSKKVKLYIKSINDTLMGDALIAGNLACVMATPGSGKSTFLINQGLFSAMQGLRICHCFIGDMEYLDGLIRYYTCYTETENSKIMVANKLLEKEIALRKQAMKRYKEGTEAYVRNEAEIEKRERQLEQNLEIDKQLESQGKKKIVLTSRQMMSFNDTEMAELLQADEKFLSIAKNVDIYKYAAAEITMDGLRQEIYNIQKQKNIHYDVIIIDYDGNLKQPSDNMYESGGIIYDQAKNLAQVNKSVVFIASQPKQSFWKNELIPIEACAESSKKQMVMDMLITIGRPEGVNTGIRKIYIPKSRRGSENQIFHAKMNGETGFMYEIFQDEYEALKKQGYDPTLIITSNNGKNSQKKEDKKEDNNGAITMSSDISKLSI